MQIFFFKDADHPDRDHTYLYDIQNAGGHWAPLPAAWCPYCGAPIHRLLDKDFALVGDACLQCWSAKRPDRFKWINTPVPCPQCLGHLQIRYSGRGHKPIASRCSAFEQHQNVLVPNPRQVAL